MRYWLKVLGWPNPEHYAGLHFDQAVARIDFPTGAGEPGMHIGDIVIVYGQGIVNILYVAQVTRQAYQANAAELAAEPWRHNYIWSVDGDNLYPQFGLNWHQYALDPFQLVDEYHRLAPGVPVTQAGNQGLGAINQGNDRIVLRPAFALFVIGQVAALN